MICFSCFFQVTYEILLQFFMVVAEMQSSGNGSSGSSAGNSESEESVNVWAKNLEEEFAKLRQVVQKYRYVAMVSGGWESINWKDLLS